MGSRSIIELTTPLWQHCPQKAGARHHESKKHILKTMSDDSKNQVSHVMVHHESRPYKKVVWTCWVLILMTCMLSLIPLLGFSAWFFAIPVFIATFVMAIIILTRGGTLQGILLLVTSITIGPVFVFCAPWVVSSLGMLGIIVAAKELPEPTNHEPASRMEEIMASNLPTLPDTVSTPKTTGDAVSTDNGPRNEAGNMGQNPKETAKVNQTEANKAVSAGTPASEVEKKGKQAKETPRFTVIQGDTAPIVFEIKTNSPTPREMIAGYVLGFGFRDSDEFTKREFIQKLNALIKEKKSGTNPDSLFGIIERVTLEEYDFEKEAFPINSNSGLTEDGFKLLDVPNQAIGSDIVAKTEYAVVVPGHIKNLPIKMDRAKTFGPALRKSREADITYIGRLANCAEVGGSETRSGNPVRLIILDVVEMEMRLAEGEHFESFEIQNGSKDGSDDPPPAASKSEMPPLSKAASSAEVANRAEDAVTAFFTAHFDKISRKDVHGFIEDYAPSVSYFGSVVSREHIHRDEQADMEKWSEIKQAVTRVEKDSSRPNTYKVFTFNKMSDGKKMVQKEVENTFCIEPHESTFQITAQAAKVLSTSP
jgi:hypothetical protein